MTLNHQFVATYKRNASMVGLRSVKPTGNYTYYHDIGTYLGESYVSIMSKIALLFNYELHEFNDYEPGDEYYYDDVSKPGIISCIFSHVEAIEVKNRAELSKRRLDQINAKNWYDSYLRKCEQVKLQRKTQQVSFEKKHSDDTDWDRMSFVSYDDDDSNFDPEENFDWETYGIERM
jgi:hypothetical protein